MNVGTGHTRMTTGESILAFARIRSEASRLPPGISSVPGPGLILASHVTDSPFGSYLELMIGESARVGAKIGWCITTVVVDKREVELTMRSGWGVPVRLGRMSWRDRDENPELTWHDRDVVVQSSSRGPLLPSYLPLTSLQRIAGDATAAPGRIRGRGRVASVKLHCLPGDELAPLAGSHPGMVIHGAKFVMDQARAPSMVPRIARATSPEPAMWFGDVRFGDQWLADQLTSERPLVSSTPPPP